ncbi:MULTISPECIES: VMAP-C domain-containing protein [Streptomyces]|uniref:VMAP-C domain-containing protein n=1 Tax=Streptomyces TaxID=1883 RepID=UPI0006EB52F3|nr:MULTISPECIES: trypsin-like peptidase domain-containing protein [Streptomyces]
MSGASWHARIECGREVGAGFLVSERRLLTCAHVVRDSGDAAVGVSFPHHKDIGTVPARVRVHGGWDGRGDDSGDLAVLELDRAVPIAPARFAAPDDAYGEPRPRLLAYGFPRGYDEGTLAEYRSTADQLIAGEWIQLEAWNAHGQVLAPGFSGAAVTRADSGRVVGMVAAAAGASGVRNGRMLPLSVMARYWPRLGELIPTPGHPAPAKERLRALVEKAADSGLAHEAERLYLDAAGPFGPPVPPQGFSSLWSAAWYVLWEVDDPDAVTRFTDRLAALLDASAAPPAPTAAGPAWAPILVEIDHSGAGSDQALVTVSAYREGHRRPVGSRTLRRDQVREYVQRRIDEAFWQLDSDAEELIAFALPRDWLNEPVAHWQRSTDDPTPLGCSYPLVVTDRARRTGGLRHQLSRTWQKLDGVDRTALHRVECGTGEKPSSLRFRLRQGGAHLAGFTAPPRADHVRPHFEASLNAPVPVLMWPRTGCEGAEDGGAADHRGHCTGTAFLDALDAHLAALPPAELPRHVLTLREMADAADEPEKHWARDVQLLWDDPRCFPGTAAPLHSPVA